MSGVVQIVTILEALSRLSTLAIEAQKSGNASIPREQLLITLGGLDASIDSLAATLAAGRAKATLDARD